MEKKIKNIIIENLQEKGVTHSNDGTPLQELGYRQLKEFAALVSVRDVDVEHSSNKWF